MNNKLRFSLLTLLVMLCGTVFAEDPFKTLTMNTADGYAELTVTKAGASSTGGEMEISKDDIIVTSAKGYIKDHEMTIYKSGTMTVSLGDSYVGNHITKVELNVSNYHFSPTITGWTAGDTYQTTDKVSGDNAEEFTPSTDDKTSITFTNVSAGKTTVKSITVYYASAAAPEPTGYTVDFNNTIVTSNHDFILGSNWGHVVGTGNYDGYGPYYMSYSYTSDGGFNGTGSLQAYRQYAGDNYGGTECYDLLVTPLVSGEITMKVKASSSASNSNPSYVEIYKIDAAGTTRGDLIQRFTAEEGYTDIEGQDDWKKITLTLTEEQRIAIRAQYVYMDDFTAASVNIIPQKALSVVSVMNMEGKDGTGGTTTYFEQLTDGTLSVPLKVLLSNTGDIDLVSGTTENYSLTLATASSASGTKTYYDDATVNVPTSLAAGASDTVEVIFNIPYTSGWKYYFVKENITGTTSSSNRYAGVTAYEPKFILRVAESTSTSSLSGVQAYGLISEETTKSFEIANTGTAPLTIKSITLPEGFTSANMPVIPAEGLVIAKGTTQALDITLPITTPGTFSGNLTIVYLDKDAAEKTYTLAFSGNVLPAGTWAADFNGENAIAFPAGSIAEGGINNDYSYSDGAYNYYLKGRTSSSYASENNKFITPKLHATAGQQLTFDVKGTSGSSYYAKVYVSTDRKTWGEPVAYYTYGEKDGAVAIGSSEWVNKAITFDAEGDYYVAFSLYGEFKIDNIIGLTKVDVAHDLYIKSINWPDASVKSGTSLSKPSLDIIPLTDETAEAYTVKYVCGETVLAEGTPVALTASANSSKTFSFSWTPSVESTTVYNGTKVVFEFTDGSKFETEGFDLTVTNEPKFHFVKTLPSSKWYEPTDYTTPISFGKTNTADKQTFYVYNWGSAPLTVKSIVAPDGFTATPAEQFIVAAFDESDMNAAAQAVEITFSATEAGNYSGDLVITYVDGAGADQTFTLAVGGTKIDPAKFYANFDNPTTSGVVWPAGSVYKGIDASSGNYSAPYNYYLTGTGTFITPKLTAAAGDKLLFDAKLYNSSWSEGKVVVYAAATREEVLNAEEGTTRVQLFSVSGQDETNPMTTDYQTFEVTVPEAGDYFFGFEISGRPYVDELYGLTAVAVENDIKIASSVVPTEAMQNVAATATVNILNFGAAEIAADAYTVKVYVDGEVVGNGTTVAIPATQLYSGNGTQVSASFRTPKVGTFPVYVEVKAGDVVVATEPVEVTFTEEAAVAKAIEVGTKSDADKSHGPVDWYNNDGSGTNWTDIVYTAKQLGDFGIKAGDKITSIAFKGSGTAKSIKAAITSWVGVKTGDITPGTVDKDAMTKVVVYDQADEAATIDFSLFNIDLSSNPIVWDGTSDIRIYTEAIRQGNGNWQNVTYDYDSNYMNSYFKSTTAVATPLGYFTLAVEPAIFSGTVKNDTGAAIEGATITLVSTDGDNVQYAGTTNAEGAYSINVIQASREYEVTVKVEGYDDQVETIAFKGESKVKNYVFGAAPIDLATVIANADFEGEYSVFSNPSADRAIYQPEGWTIDYKNGEGNDMTSLNSSCTQWNQFEGRPQPTNGGNNTYWIRFRWGNSETMTLSQNVTLPAGEYRLTADAFFNGATGATASIMASGVTTNVEGNNAWKNYSVDFSLAEETAVTLGFSLKQTSATENVAAFDNFKLVYLADVIKIDLQNEIASAEAIYADESKTEGREAFAAAIATAKGALSSVVVAEVRQAIADLKAAEQTFLVANLPLQEGTYYVYNAYAKKFLSRGDNYGVRAVADDFGLPFNVTVDMTNTTYKLQMYDSKGYYGDDYWMYSDCSGNRVRSYSLEKVDGGFYLRNSNRATAADNRMYVYMKDDADKWAIAGNAIVGDNVGDEAQTVWQFVTAEQRNAIIAANAAAQKTAAFTAAGIAEDATLEVADATELTFKTGSAWIYTAGPNKGGTPDVNDNGTELYQATGNFAQTVENLESGLYKVSIQAFYRGGGNGDVVAAYGQGHDLSTVSLYANGTVIRVNSWAADRAADDNPNGMGAAAALFAEGKYLAEGYAFVGEDKTLSLKVFVPSFIGAGWFIASNVKYAKVEEAVIAGDANLDGEVSAGDAIATVYFALEVETPSAKAFKAADVNKSNSLTVSDVVGIVNIALNNQSVPSAPARVQHVAENNALALNGNILSLANTTEFVAFQMDVTVAPGAQFRGVELSSRASGLNVSYNRVAENTYRVVAFSLNNDAIEMGEGAICTFDIIGNKTVQVTNIEFADAAARAYALELGETTRINGIAAGAAGAEFFSVGGVKSDKAQKGMNVVRTADGKVKKVLVK